MRFDAFKLSVLLNLFFEHGDDNVAGTLQAAVLNEEAAAADKSSHAADEGESFP